MQGAVVMLILFLLLVILRVPMAVSIGLSSLVGLIMSNIPLSMLGQTSFESLYSFSTVAIPFFIFAGSLMSEGGISRKLVDLAQIMVGRLVGGLGMVMVVACAFFAALSGSSTATTVAIGGMLTPEMERNGYDKDYALALAAAGGVLGPIIPPSIGFVLYGVITNTSVSDLFLAGLLPGIVMMLCLLTSVYLTAKKRGYTSDMTQRPKDSFAKTLWSAKWAILVPVIILGGIYGGVFTPTEAGAVACVYALVICIFEKRMSPRKLLETLADSAIMTASTLFIIGSATAFGRVLVLAQIPQMISRMIISISNNGFVAMLLINLLLLITGCLMDAVVAILILSPILLPVAEFFGYTALHFGVILIANITIGAITPPIGCCLFASSIMGNRPIEKIAKAALPFLIALLISLTIITCVPWLSEGPVELMNLLKN